MQTINQTLISILTPNYNTEDEIIEFLDSILKQDYPLKSIEIVLIDNGSTDNSVHKINSWLKNNQLFYRTLLIELEKNMGIAHAYNVGYENISSVSSIIIRTESDVELDSNCVSSLVNTLLNNSSFGVVGAKGIFFHDRKRLNHAARYLNWWSGTLSEFEPSNLIECDCVFGGTFAVRKELVQKMGYFFKPDRFLANELEFCTRIKLEFMKVLCQPFAVSYHKGGNTTRKLSQKKFSFINIRESTLFHLEFNNSFKKFTSVSLLFFSSVKHLFSSNPYAIWGFFSAFFSYILKKNILLPSLGTKTISEWLK